MDRRRFVPSAEGLEGRALQAGLFGGVGVAPVAPATTVPETYALKEKRIERIPLYLEEIRSGRYLPAATISALENDLTAIAARLHAASPPTLTAFNTALRNVMPSSSLSIPDAKRLNNAFGNAVASTGATPQEVTNLKNDMNALAKVDANSPQSVFLATNDYTLILETLLAVGRPIRKPSVPQLATGDGTRVNEYVGVTTHHQPTFVGRYDAFATVQIIDGTGKVYGQAPVTKYGPTETNGVANATGYYRLTLDQPLPDGLYTFFARAVDDLGHVSNLSPAFKLKVITLPRDQTAAEILVPPGGPLGVKHG